MGRDLQILSPANFHLYQEWRARAVEDFSTWRYLGVDGWSESLESAPKDDWGCLILISDRTLIRFGFDRGVTSNVMISGYTVGTNKERATGIAMIQSLAYLRRYSYFARVGSKVVETNEASMKLTRHLLGEPWGIQPDTAWDPGLNRIVGLAHFSAPLSPLLERYSHIDPLRRRKAA
jgi:hypothetical protein